MKNFAGRDIRVSRTARWGGDIPASLLKAQASSVVATCVDFAALVSLVQILHAWYVVATAMGAALGAVTNFFLGRHWTFRAAAGPMKEQALKYFLVALGSLGLNTGGVYFFTEKFAFPYWVSKIITAVLVGVFFNFTLHRSFVFGRMMCRESSDPSTA